MRLSEALIVKADLKTRLVDLRSRIGANAVTQEGKEPAEDVEQLLKEAYGLLQQLREMAVRVNATNERCKLPDGRTISEALARRMELNQRHSMVRTAIEGTKHLENRYSLSEIAWIPCLDVRQKQKQLNDFSTKIRELNLMIQETNWTTDLV